MNSDSWKKKIKTMNLTQIKVSTKYENQVVNRGKTVVRLAVRLTNMSLNVPATSAYMT